MFSVGVVFSHYSTAYLLLGTLGFAWVAKACVFRSCRRTPKDPGAAEAAGPAWRYPSGVMVIGLANLAVIVLALGVWNGAATQTSVD